MDIFLSTRCWEVTTDSQAISDQQNLKKDRYFLLGDPCPIWQCVVQIIVYKFVIITYKQNNLKINAFA